ncbi:glycine betaine/proline transport system ATP-binding protein [Methanococcus voltae]|uniref:quaternary amine ABC transporter ATP-binding protein n=1 Tax=Methanococcus voltae TaxID=2188 RepID=UPI001AE87631|nr:glycine betaine/L-proline ABC transporter ATP-binding protein [Methanococcus voltae]MBP2143626.1 glycine betaine/proline transport system ATP-binding protein [Methanococcus voltae]
MTLIEVNKLYKIFGKKPEKAYPLIEEGLTRTEIKERIGNVVGLRNINFEVKEGEIFVVMGLSGSGKSTLLRCINRLIPTTSGSILIDGTNICDLSKKELRNIRTKYFGMVFQKFGLLPNRTVLDNVALGLEVQKMPQKERYEKSEKAIELVGLSGWEQSKITELSGGMQQRVGIARALSIDPKILLMDEPFSALDPIIRVEMQELLLKIQKKMKKTIIFITHDLNEAIKLGDKIMILNEQGELVQMGTPEQILLEPASDFVESFVKEVDKTTVIRVEMLMKKPKMTITLDTDISSAIQTLEKLEMDYAYVLDGGKYVGIVEAEQLKACKSVADCIIKTKTVEDIKTINQVLPVFITSEHPVPVVDIDGLFMGYVDLKDVVEVIKD